MGNLPWLPYSPKLGFFKPSRTEPSLTHINIALALTRFPLMAHRRRTWMCHLGEWSEGSGPPYCIPTSLTPAKGAGAIPCTVNGSLWGSRSLKERECVCVCVSWGGLVPQRNLYLWGTRTEHECDLCLNDQLTRKLSKEKAEMSRFC